MVVESKSVGGLIQIDAERFVGIEFPGLGDEDVGKIGVDAPVAPLVGVGQGAA